MSGIDRYLSVLSLFTEDKSTWTALELSVALTVPQSTVYRTIRELARVQMLEQARDGRYRLGAAFVELDRRARLTDPLVRAGVPMLSEIVEQAGLPCVAVLARLHGDTVMCVADVRSEGTQVQTSYERGRPRPLTRGATSKVILAQLNARQLGRLLITIGEASSSGKLRAELAAIRRRGFCITRSEVDAGRVGIALPISLLRQAIVASVSIVANEDSVDAATEERLRTLLASFAARLETQLTGDGESAS